MTRATLAKIFTSLDDRPKRKPSRDELILLYMPMVERIARRECRKQRSYGKQFICLEDIRGELTVNLIRLIDRYEEGRSDSLEAYLAQYLGEWRAVDAVEKSQAIRDTHEPFVNASGNEAICADQPRSMGLEYSARGRRRGKDGDMHSIPVHEHSTGRLDVGVLLEQLDGTDRAIIETYRAMLTEAELADRPDITQSEVAAVMQVNQATVSRAIKKIRALVHKAPKIG
jgi:RNA polymerase sigma factor (sigma-70 family)